MPSWLLNDKMSPELRSRVLRSLGVPAGHARVGPRAIALLRFAALAGILGSVAAWSWMQHHVQDELTQAKRGLSRELRAARRDLSPTAFQLESRVRPWIRTATAEYLGDERPTESGRSDVLAELLSQDAVYLRGPLIDLQDERSLRRVASESRKDALLFCLLSPPAEATESAMLPKLSGGIAGERAAHVQRLLTGLVGLPLLAPSWQERVERAEFIDDVRELRRMVEAAPLADARRAALADLFILALDEPKLGDGPSEFDGTNRHFVRVFVIDMKKAAVLLSVRRLVDPAWISESRRHRHARDLTSCRLAREIHYPDSVVAH